MANPTLVVRVAASLAELKQNLAEGKNQIETTTAAMAKLSTSLKGDKLIQNAHNIVAAVNQLGGAAKLTEAEKARLNSTLSKAIEKYQKLGRDAPKAMVDLEQATRKVEGTTSALDTKMVALGSAIGSFIGNLAYDAVRQLGSAMASLVSEGLRTQAVVDAFSRLALSIGETKEAMLSATRDATKGLIADLDIMQASNKAMLLGLPVTAKEMGKLAEAAVSLGRAMGQDANKSLDDLIVALGRSSPMILDNLGLTVKVGEANEIYAKKLGRTAESLTDAEKKTAFYQAALAAAETKVQTLGGVQLTLADSGARVLTSFTNLIHGATRLVAEGLKPVGDGLGVLPQQALDVGVAIGTLAGALAAVKVGAMAYTATMASGGIAAASLTGVVGALSAAMAVLAPVVVAVGGAWLGWRIGTYIGQVTGLTDGVEYLTGKLMGLSDAHLAASKAAREQHDIYGRVTAYIRSQGTPGLQAFALRGLKPVALAFDEVTATIKVMDAGLRTSNEQARTIAAESAQRAAELTKRIQDEMALRNTAALERAKLMDFIGLREIKDGAEKYERDKKAREDEQTRLTENAAAHRAMLNEIGVARMEYEANRLAQEEAAKVSALEIVDQTASGTLAIFGALGQKFKAAAIAGAIIATYMAVAKALAASVWPFNLIQAAGALAAGMANVMKIRSSKAGFKSGTPRLDFMDFGRESMRPLHGQEAVIPRGGGHRLAGEIATSLTREGSAESGVREEIAGLRRDIARDRRQLPRLMVIAWKDALAHG